MQRIRRIDNPIASVLLIITIIIIILIIAIIIIRRLIILITTIRIMHWQSQARPGTPCPSRLSLFERLALDFFDHAERLQF